MALIRRRTLLNALAATLSLAAALTVAELATRRLRPELTVGANERVFFGTYDPRLGWRNRPNVDGTFFGTHVRHNASGQRDKERQPARRGKGPRVMVLGDSFVWGFRIEASDRFTDRLEQMMPGSDILNFGCSGYGQDQEYLLLEREIRRWRPDVVVVMIHVASDLENNRSAIQYGYHKPLFRIVGGNLALGNVPVPGDSTGTLVDRWMTPRLALWNLLMNQRAGGVTLRERFVGAANALDSSAAETPHSKGSRTELTCRLCTAMEQVSARNGAATLYVLIPNVDFHDQAIVGSRDYDRLRTCLGKQNLPVLDLEPVFRTYQADHPGAALTLRTDRHWSAEGNAVVAHALDDYFHRNPPSVASGPRSKPASAL